MNRRAILLIAIGLVAALGAASVVFLVINNAQRPAPQQPVVVSGPTPVPRRAVLVAATDIQANSVITTAQVVTGSYPADLVPADALKSIDEAVGTTARTPVFSGQILLQRQFLAAQGRTGASVNIPAGKVLVAFPSTDMLNATGAVQAGDHVDIMLSLPISGTTRIDSAATTGSQEAGAGAGAKTLTSQATLQNIEVYSIGQWTPPGQQANGPAAGAQPANANNGLKIITFIVDHQEALILKYIKDSGGTIDLAVRSAADNKNVATDPVSLDYLVDLFGFIGLNQPAANKAKP